MSVHQCMCACCAQCCPGTVPGTLSGTFGWFGLSQSCSRRPRLQAQCQKVHNNRRQAGVSVHAGHAQMPADHWKRGRKADHEESLTWSDARTPSRQSVQLIAAVCCLWRRSLLGMESPIHTSLCCMLVTSSCLDPGKDLRWAWASAAHTRDSQSWWTPVVRHYRPKLILKGVFVVICMRKQAGLQCRQGEPQTVRTRDDSRKVMGTSIDRQVYTTSQPDSNPF